MNFRNVHDLEKTLVQGLHRLPGDIDLVAGVPRSGIIPASLIALHRNLPLTDVRGLRDRRLLGQGRRLEGLREADIWARCRRVLVMDDSLVTGSQMRITQAEIDAMCLPWAVHYAVAYGIEPMPVNVDTVFETCPVPRIFSWNLFHHSTLQHCCVDIDGVVCHDPLQHENDDGPHYERFVLNARPLWVPTAKVGAFVTSRLEKYRLQTEAWLRCHNIEYGELIMCQLESAAERRQTGAHGTLKAAAFKARDWASLFIESEYGQAATIARESLKPVLTMDRQEIIEPRAAALLVGAARKTPRVLTRHLRALKDRLLNLNRY